MLAAQIWSADMPCMMPGRFEINNVAIRSNDWWSTLISEEPDLQRGKVLTHPCRHRLSSCGSAESMANFSGMGGQPCIRLL